MPHFFFHVEDGRAYMDPEGIELHDADTAIHEAMRTAGEIIREGDFIGEEWTMRVVDDHGKLIKALRFSGSGQLVRQH